MCYHNSIWRLNPGEVHLWHTRISEMFPILAPYACYLSEEEKQKLNHFCNKISSHTFVVSRIMLRLILAAYIDCDPLRITFEIGKYGKLRLPDHPKNKGICFNNSHSNDIAIVAVTANSDIGVDIEFIRPVKELRNIITQNFSEHEQTYLLALNGDFLFEGFFLCWTLKEAFIKAVGKGLSYPLNTFSTFDCKGSEPVRRNVLIHGNSYYQYFQSPINFLPGYSSAIALKEYCPSLKSYDFAHYFKDIH